MHINIIGVPLFYGCDNKGVLEGFSTLVDGKIEEIFKYNGQIVNQMVKIPVEKALESEKYIDDKRAKYLSFIVNANNKIGKMVNDSLDKEVFPIIIGGDHSLSMGSIAGSSKFFNDIDNFAVIWIDAHADLNTIESSPSGNIHGMPLAASIGVGDSRLTDIYFKGRKVKHENIFIIGCRDIDKGERELIKRLKINTYEMDVIKEKGIAFVVYDILKKLHNIENVHLSFD